MALEGLYLQSVLPPGAVSQVVACNLIPMPWRDTPYEGKRQAVLLKESWLEVISVSNNGEPPQTLCQHPVHGVARSAAALPLQTDDLDVLVFTSDSGQLSFLYYDLRTSRLRTYTHFTLERRPGFEREDLGHLIVVDKQMNLVAISALEKNINIYKMDPEISELNLKLVQHFTVHGLILSMCFLDGIALIVLIKNARRSELQVYPIRDALIRSWPFKCPLKELLNDDHGEDPQPRMVVPVPDSPFEITVVTDVRVAVFDVRPVLHSVEVDVKLLPSSSIPYRVGQAIAEFEQERSVKEQSSCSFWDQEREGTRLYICSVTWIKAELVPDEPAQKVLIVSLENGDLFMIRNQPQKIGNYGPCNTMTSLQKNYLVLCGDGCDGGVRKLSLDGKGKVKLELQLELLNLSPASNFAIDDDEKEIFVCAGIGDSGSLRRIKVCLPMQVQSKSDTVMVGCDRIWAVKKKTKDRYHKFLVLSYVESTTTVLSVDGSTKTLRDNVQDSGFILSSSTHAVGLMRDNIAAQVHLGGIRLSAYSDEDEDNPPMTFDLRFEEGMKVTCALVKRGIIIVSAVLQNQGPQLHIYKYDDGRLKRSSKALTAEVSSIEFWSETDMIILGTRAPSLDLYNVNTLELISDFSLEECHQPPNFPASAEPGGMKEMNITKTASGDLSSQSTPECVKLHISDKPRVVASLRGGTLIALDVIDQKSLANLQCKFMDFAPGELIYIRMGITRSFLLLSDQVWLVQFKGGRMTCTPTSFAEAKSGTTFCSPGLEGGIAMISKGALYILKPRRRNSIATQKLLLHETPRRVILSKLSDGSKIFIVASTSTSQETGFRSTLRVFRASTNEQIIPPRVFLLEMIHAIVAWEDYLVIGTSVQDPETHMFNEGRILFYRLISGESSDDQSANHILEDSGYFNHKRGVYALAYHERSGKLLAGVSTTVIVWSTTSDQEVFRRESNAILRDNIVSISCYEDSIVVSDRKDSVHLFEMDSETSRLIPKKNDARRRAVSDCLAVDENFILGADKYGSIFGLSSDPVKDANIGRSWLKPTHSIFAGEPVVCLRRGKISYVEAKEPREVTPLLPGHVLLETSDCVIGLTINGRLIALSALEKSTYDVLEKVQELAATNKHSAPLLGNEHKKYRAAYGENLKRIIDGDLLCQLLELEPEHLKEILASEGDEEGGMLVENADNVLKLLENFHEFRV